MIFWLVALEHIKLGVKELIFNKLKTRKPLGATSRQRGWQILESRGFRRLGLENARLEVLSQFTLMIVRMLHRGI